uniref:Glycosyltransferase n=1 Tax=Araucaria cunninghamii TaxID=56994 RepID=A0A0D6QXT7_ARACU
MDANGYGGRMKAHVVVISYPATGHTNPMLQFCKNLGAKGLVVTFVSFKVNHHKILQAKNSLERLKLDIRFECIPDGLPEDRRVDSNLNPSVFKHMLNMTDDPGLETLIRRLNATATNPPVCCIVYNSFLPWVRRVANKLSIPHALFWTQSAAIFSIYRHFQHDEEWDSSRMPESVAIPGLPELKLADLPSAFRDTDGFLNNYLRQMENIESASWVLANTITELERHTIDSLRSRTSIPFRAIGPCIPSAFLSGRSADDAEVRTALQKATDCIKWLDSKPPLSVVYISFGTVTDISAEQIKELALGIQRSGHNFVWVVRPPPGHDRMEQLLPATFVEETKERGLLVEWCEQLKVLSHPSVAAFISHCGWNSTLDALCCGVPVLALGVWTDQPTNSKFVTDVWKTGMKVRRRKDGSVGADEIERCMRISVEGKEGREIRNNALKWREAARGAMEEGGTSDVNLEEFVREMVAKAKEAKMRVV